MLVDVESPAVAGEAVQAVLHSPLVPSAIELSLPDGRRGQLAILLEGVPPGVEAQTRTALGLLGQPRLRPRAATPCRPRPTAGPGTRATPASSCARRRRRCRRCWPRPPTSPSAPAWRLRVQAHAGSGIAHAGLRGGETAAVAAADRGHPQPPPVAREGSAELLHAGDALRQRVDAFGPVGDAGPLMRRLKAQFDPERVLNPGRYAEGI